MKKFLVIGLGRFGQSVAHSLANQKCEVMILDKEEARLQDVRDEVTYALIGDATDRSVLEKIGVKNFDTIIVCIGDSLEASVMVTVLSKELGASRVIVKAQNEMHAKVLNLVGADKVVLPERDMGARLAKSLTTETFMDYIELSDSHSIIEMEVPKSWTGKTILELDVRKKFGINILAIKKGDGLVNAAPGGGATIEPDDIIVVLGEKKSLEKLC